MSTISICREAEQRDAPWRRPNYATIHRMIDNPIYGGAYAYGKTAQHRDTARRRQREEASQGAD